MTNRRITVQVPEIRVVPLEAVPELIGKPDQVIAAVVMQVLGDLTGRTVQVFPAATARQRSITSSTGGSISSLRSSVTTSPRPTAPAARTRRR